MTIRDFSSSDVPALQRAIDVDTFHPGEWTVEHFYNPQPDPEKYNPAVQSEVIEDSQGVVTFVRFTKTLRISCVWNNAADVSRNARVIVRGIKDAVTKARAGGFSEIIITTHHPRLADFLEKVIKMTRRDSEFLLLV